MNLAEVAFVDRFLEADRSASGMRSLLFGLPAFAPFRTATSIAAPEFEQYAAAQDTVRAGAKMMEFTR